MLNRLANFCLLVSFTLLLVAFASILGNHPGFANQVVEKSYLVLLSAIVLKFALNFLL